MAHIVITTFDLPSLSNVLVELSRRLGDRGHLVTFVCPVHLVEWFEQQGERAVGLSHDERFDEELAALGAPSTPIPTALVRWIGHRRRLRDRSLTADEIREAVSGLQPDLVITAVEFHAAVLAVHTLDCPQALITTNTFTVFRRPGLPPLSSGLPPPTDLRSKLKVRAAWWWVRAGARYQRLRGRFGIGGLAAQLRPMPLETVELRDLTPLARRLGVDLGSFADFSQWLRPYVPRELPLLCCNPWELELPHDPPTRMQYLGALVRADRRERAMEPEARQRWDAIREARRGVASDQARPLVYASLGTVWSADRNLLSRLVSAFELHPEWDLVIGLGGGLKPAELEPLPSNVLATGWAPQLEVLDEADVALTHGGTGTIVEAVCAAVPLVVYSAGFVDHDGNAQRVAHHGLGVIGDPAADSGPDIAASIGRALTDPSIRASVDRMSGVLADQMEGGLAVTVVESLLQRDDSPLGRQS